MDFCVFFHLLAMHFWNHLFSVFSSASHVYHVACAKIPINMWKYPYIILMLEYPFLIWEGLVIITIGFGLNILVYITTPPLLILWNLPCVGIKNTCKAAHTVFYMEDLHARKFLIIFTGGLFFLLSIVSLVRKLALIMRGFISDWQPIKLCQILHGVLLHPSWWEKSWIKMIYREVRTQGLVSLSPGALIPCGGNFGLWAVVFLFNPL